MEAPGNYDPARFGPWESSRILLVPDIHSKHKSRTFYKVAIMYVPTTLPVQHNWMGYRQPQTTGRIKAVCCGPSLANYCPVGSRTVAPCAHGATILFAGCCVAANPLLYKSTHTTMNIMDPGRGLPVDYARDLLTNTIS